jgi:uncharacterized protein (DUF2147 family)
VKFQRGIAIGVILAATSLGVETSSADRILGTWVVSGAGSTVEIVRCGSDYCGYIKSLAKPLNDIHNSDPTRRSRPLLGLQILTGLKYDSANVWKGGRLYGPERGKEGIPKATLTGPDLLEIKVTIGIASKTVNWSREK